MIGRLFQDQQKRGQMDFEATEMAIRHSMHEVGGVLLERFLGADSGGRLGTRIPCGLGHEASFLDYRTKRVTTVLSVVAIGRAYYHCPDCQKGLIPKDQDLDIVGTSFSPGVRRMMARVGAKESFDEGRSDLEALAGVMVTTKAVERVSEKIGGQIEVEARKERENAMKGNVIPLWPVIPKMYIAIDGTGVPVSPSETEGRKGKDETGIAKTRESKLGCVFTQSKLDKEGYAVRDDDSTTYVGAIETAEECGKRIYAEAVRRGLNRAQKVTVLGDGAPWIWGISSDHFPGAIQIVDLYHALEHIAHLGKILYGPRGWVFPRWIETQSEALKEGEVEKVIAVMKRLKPQDHSRKEEVRKTINYFETNKDRMRYADFRKQGLFVGSGVMEAGCKTIVGQRLKQSGMRWTVQGANAIIALRCTQISSRWEEFWENRTAG